MSGDKNLHRVVNTEDSISLQRNGPTLRSAPDLELNRVAVTTLRFLGSTAPTAISGVSTIPTIFGGAVNTAARPNSILCGFAIEAESGVAERSAVGLRRGVVGVRGGTLRLSLPLDILGVLPFAPSVDVFSEMRRGGVEIDDVDRANEGTVFERACLVDVVTLIFSMSFGSMNELSAVMGTEDLGLNRDLDVDVESADGVRWSCPGFAEAAGVVGVRLAGESNDSLVGFAPVPLAVGGAVSVVSCH